MRQLPVRHQAGASQKLYCTVVELEISLANGNESLKLLTKGPPAHLYSYNEFIEDAC